VVFRRHHYIIEVLGEHRSCEESDGAQCFLTDIDQVVFHRRWNGKNTPRTDAVGAAIFHVQFPGSGDNVLRLLGGIGMPAEPFPRLDLINDRGRCGGAMAAIHGESTSPMNRFIIFSPPRINLSVSHCPLTSSQLTSSWNHGRGRASHEHGVPVHGDLAAEIVHTKKHLPLAPATSLRLAATSTSATLSPHLDTAFL